MNQVWAAKHLDMYNNAVIDNSAVPAVNQAARTIVANKARYDHLQVPWQAIGCLHLREPQPSFNWGQHLANGDPLTADTTHVPAGIMAPLQPPYSWEEGALAAIQNWAQGWNVDLSTFTWDIPHTLWFLQSWHGFGCDNVPDPDSPILLDPPKLGVNDPYLWNFTQFYSEGDWGSDGNWNPEEIDENIGCVAILKILNYSQGVVS